MRVPTSFRVLGMTVRPGEVVVMALFFGCLALFGGASRADEPAQLVVRLAALVAILWAAWQPAQLLARPVPAFRLLAAAVLVVAVQLVPLPPAWWAELPGHARYAELDRLLPPPPPWRPLTMTPDATWNALLAFLPPAAALFLAVRMGRGRQPLLALIVMTVAVLSIGLGLLQLATGQALTTYRLVTEASPVGLLANRNHQAVLVAALVPLLAWWGAPGIAEQRIDWLKVGGALAATVFCLAFLLIIGSRAGLGVGLLTALASFLFWRERVHSRRPALWGRLRWPLAGGGVLLLTLVAAGAVLSGRAETVRRLLAESPEQDTRRQVLGPLAHMTRDFMPFGSGMGSFDAIYKGYEPTLTLTQNYVNAAHSDWLQLPLEAGLAGVLVAAGYMLWWFRRSWRLWLGRERHGATLGRVGTVVTAAVLLGSGSDYPLRTPLMASVFVLASLWMAAWPERRRERADYPLR